jgi:CRISPR-associated endonuclease/helicase Cas3
VAALDELARNYGCSIVLCTATQPALQEPRFPGGFEIGPERELAPDPARLHRELKRTTERLAGVMTDDDLVAELSKVDQTLTMPPARIGALSGGEVGRPRRPDPSHDPADGFRSAEHPQGRSRTARKS